MRRHCGGQRHSRARRKTQKRSQTFTREQARQSTQKNPPGTGDFQTMKNSPCQATPVICNVWPSSLCPQVPAPVPSGASASPSAFPQGWSMQTESQKADSTLRSSRAVPHPSTNRALRRLTSEVGRDSVYSTRYGRQRNQMALKRNHPDIQP